MQKKRFYYIVRLQYLGFRFSGWQKQPGQLTIERMLVKTLKFILPDTEFKILGAGRTDAKVSSLDGAFELFVIERELPPLAEFIHLFNSNLPSDIRVTGIIPTTADFNIIQQSKSKEYIYLFSYGSKNHPFCAPFLTNVLVNLDIELMKEAAALFEGTHDFSAYTAKLQPNTKVVREVYSCEIVTNSILTANFFPKESFALIVNGAGFMRYQIRMMMGALFQVGKGELSIDEIKESLKADSNVVFTTVAPGSGLLLNKLSFD
ncbi:tRNA pseudouridine synthase A [Maribacter chungangensis]|uniref:tRNA pseudouridine synthase A n=1 Tax=Maribacter chungangensis TaxID=1069117 RepID=A0ABW3B4M2_9FLAO